MKISEKSRFPMNIHKSFLICIQIFNMRRFIFLLFPFFLSCSDEKTINLVPEEKMAAVLLDIHLLEGKVNEMHLGSVDSSLVVYNYLEKKIFKKHQIDSAAFNQCLAAYLREPKQFKRLYQKVTNQINSLDPSKVKPSKTL